MAAVVVNAFCIVFWLVSLPDLIIVFSWQWILALEDPHNSKLVNSSGLMAFCGFCVQ